MAIKGFLSGAAALAFFVVSSSADAAVQDRCSLRLSYQDWDSILDRTVMTVGEPDRRSLGRPSAPTGSRIIRGNTKRSRTEGNRVFYHLITDDGRAYLEGIQQSLVDTANDSNFGSLCADERLALWLNLHNVAVVSAISAAYPMENARDHIESRLDEPIATINGEAWSIRDIELHVSEKWEDPLVIYGFHRGYIGSPNIRSKAYNGKSVWDDLAENADDFIASLRGTMVRGGTVRVSSFYADFKHVFGGSDARLLDHLVTKASLGRAPRLNDGRTVRYDLHDDTVADLFMGVRVDGRTHNFSAGVDFASNYPWLLSALGPRVSELALLPPHAQEFVFEVVKRRLRKRYREGEVTIEGVSEGK